MKQTVILAVFLVALAVITAIAIIRSHRDSSPNFVGKYTTSFEVSSFVPCDSPETKYWLVWKKPIDLSSEMRKVGADGFGSEVFLKFEGSLETGGGGYGHLGAYDGQLEITKLLAVSRESLCR